MARPSNAPMEKSLMRISKEGLARLLADELRTTKKLREILNRIKELYEDEEEAELLNYLDEILDEI